MMVREIDRPTPMPWRLVVMNGWNNCALISGAIPVPVSATLISTMLVRRRRRRDYELAPFRFLHRLEGVPHQIEQDLLHLYLVREHEIDSGIEVKTHAHAAVLGPDQSERARLLDQLLDVLDSPFALAARDEVAQAADDLAGPQSLFGRLVHGVAQNRGALVGIALRAAGASPSCSWRSPKAAG